MRLRESKEQKTRLMIMQTAFELFCAQDIESIDFAQIAQAAEISRPTLYRYFESKDRLAEAIYLWNLGLIAISYPPVDLNKSCFQLIQGWMQINYSILVDQPLRFVYDLMYNLYASRLHTDPTLLAGHPLNPNSTHEYISFFSAKLNDGSIRFEGALEDLLNLILYPYFAYLQRLAVFATQKGPSGKDMIHQQALQLLQFYMRILTPEENPN